MKGRPTKLTKEMVDQICLFIENGNTQKDACLLAGISEAGFYNWVSHAKELEDGGERATNGNKLYFYLLESLKRAEAQFRAFHLSRINAASKKSWQASAWMLERRYPREFGRHVYEFDLPEDTVIPVQVYLPDNGRDKTTG